MSEDNKNNKNNRDNSLRNWKPDDMCQMVQGQWEQHKDVYLEMHRVSSNTPP
jgi:hypothetical protein